MKNFYKSCKLVFLVAVVLLLVTVSTTGCVQIKPSSETGVISQITLSKAVDEKNRPIEPTNVFATDAAGFYVSFMMSGFPVGAKVEVKWIYVGGDPEVEEVTGKNYVAETQNATVEKKGRGYTYTVYAHPGIPGYTWPKGDWKVEISVDGFEKGSATFRVE